MHPAKRVGRRNAKRAARLTLQRARYLFRRFGLGEDALAVSIVSGACLGHREAPRCAVEKTNTQAFLEPLHMSADSRFGDFQPARRGREASAVHDASECSNAVERSIGRLSGNQDCKSTQFRLIGDPNGVHFGLVLWTTPRRLTMDTKVTAAVPFVREPAAGSKSQRARRHLYLQGDGRRNGRLFLAVGSRVSARHRCTAPYPYPRGRGLLCPERRTPDRIRRRTRAPSRRARRLLFRRPLAAPRRPQCRRPAGTCPDPERAELRPRSDVCRMDAATANGMPGPEALAAITAQYGVTIEPPSA